MYLLETNSPISAPNASTDALPPSAAQDASPRVGGTPGTLQGLESPTTAVFPSKPPAPLQPPCSFNACLAGHIWPAVLAVGGCPGCTGHILAVQKTNCPFCNEPATRTILRSDFVPAGAGLSARCKGQNVIGESLDIELMRTGWQEAEAKELTFLEKEGAKTDATA